MPKVTSQRTFTACWTCRRRRIRCDNAVPRCAQCARSRLTCEGYGIRLVWVDSETKAYEQKQRRVYPGEQTWQGYPSWSLGEVGHLVKDAEQKRCRCSLHRHPSPFTTFPAETAPTLSRQHENALQEEVKECLGSPQTSLSESAGSIVLTSTLSDEDDQSDCWEISLTPLAIAQVLSTPLVPDGSREDNHLFHHYVSNVSARMVPVNDDCNPWKSTYPSLAILDTTSTSSRSLLHAILAQSAFHLANLTEPKAGKYLKSAMQHFGSALRHLRSSLASPKEDFSGTLAAMLTITLAGHVFHGQSKGLRHHVQGAVQYVAQYLGQKPWLLSYDAWVVTQSFVLHTLVSQTATGTTPIASETDTMLHQVLEDVVMNPHFACTLGSTPRLMKALYHARLLELQLAPERCSGAGQLHLLEEQLVQVSKILAQLNAPLEAEVDVYMSRRPLMATSVHQRKLIESNLSLFTSAVHIYLHCTVLRYPPSAVVEQVSQVLSAAMTLLQSGHAAVSIWPIFIASTEAYTSEMQALADCVLGLLEGRGAANRAVVRRVVKRIWQEREAVAADDQREVGEVIVNWREVLEKLDLDVLLL